MASTLRVDELTPHLTVYNVASLTLGLSIIYCITGWVYNIYFHPLSKYPGSKRAAASQIFHSRAWLSGQYPYIIKSLHDKYGPVVRTGPNQLSYCSPTSWKDIYGHASGRKQFLKSDWYDDGTAKNVASARDPHQHLKMRRDLNPGFTTKALVEQEVLVQQFVDKLIDQISIHGTGKEGMDMANWYNCLTFDVIGDLAFGEAFGCLANGVQHFWVTNILGSMKAYSWIVALNKSSILKSFMSTSLMNALIPKKVMDARLKHFEYTREKAIKRMESTSPRMDLLSGLVMKQKMGDGITIDEVQSQAGLLIIAGSETTATALSGTTYQICHDTAVRQKLVEEIRSAFNSYDEITGATTEKLTYLKAVLDEGFRIYPPVSFGAPRLSPGETVDGVYVPEGTEVFTSSLAATHSEDNFHRPFDFLPERWLDPECTDKKQASQPFLLGSRLCLGRSLALVEMRVVLCKILWTYDIQMVDPNYDWVKGNSFYLLWNKPELRVKFARRPGVIVPPLDK